MRGSRHLIVVDATSSIFLMVTSSRGTPAAAAMASLNFTCLSDVKVVVESGSESTIRTKCAGAAVTAGIDGGDAGFDGEFAGAEDETVLTQSDSSMLPGAAVFPAGQPTHASEDRAASAAE